MFFVQVDNFKIISDGSKLYRQDPVYPLASPIRTMVPFFLEYIIINLNK